MNGRRTMRSMILLAFIVLPALWMILWGRHLELGKKVLDFGGITEGEMAEDVTISGNDGLLQQIKLFNSGDSYTVFLPAEMEKDARVYFSKFESLKIAGNHTYRNGSTLRDLSDGITYDAELLGWGYRQTCGIKLTFYQADSIPTMYIMTEDGTTAEIDGSKAAKIKAHFMTIDADGERSGEGECKMKSRGQSSFDMVYDQKSYNLKMDHFVSPFEMDSSSEWALLANYGGFSGYNRGVHQLTNKMTFDLARKMGMEFAPDSRFCNLYVDGNYRGLYLLAQRATVDGGSVRIDDMSAEHEENSGAFDSSVLIQYTDEDGSSIRYRRSDAAANDRTGGYLLEKNMRYGGEDNYFTVSVGFPVVIKSPETMTADEFGYISSYVRRAVDVLNQNNISAEELKQYFDFDSWLRFYLLEDFAAEGDAENDSFKFYKKRGDSHLYAGPVWDFDLGYGSTWMAAFPQLMKRTMFLKDDVHGWLSGLAECNEFRQQLKDLYNNVFSPAVYEYINSDFLRIARENKTSLEMSFIRWNREETNYEKDVNRLYTWVMGRRAFLDEYVNHPDSFCRVMFGKTSYYVRKGELIDYLPRADYGAEDYGQYTEVINWRKRDRTAFDVSQPVTEDMTLTAYTGDEDSSVYSSVPQQLRGKVHLAADGTLSLDLSEVTLPFAVGSVYAYYEQEGIVVQKEEMRSHETADAQIYSCRLDLSGWNDESSIGIGIADSSGKFYPSLATILGDLNLLENHHDFLGYINALRNAPDSYTVVAAGYDEFSTGLTEEMAEALHSIGFPKDLFGKFRYGYAGIVDGYRSDARLGLTDNVLSGTFRDQTPFYLKSTGWYAGADISMQIAGTEYASPRRGLTFVAYDNASHQVVDTVNFDTYAPPAGDALHDGVSVELLNNTVCVAMSRAVYDQYRIEKVVLSDASGEQKVLSIQKMDADEVLFTGKIRGLHGLCNVDISDIWHNRYAGVQKVDIGTE